MKKKYGGSSQNSKYGHHMIQPHILGYTLKEDEITVWKTFATFTFTAASFTIAKTCKQPKGTLMDEWIKKM